MSCVCTLSFRRKLLVSSITFLFFFVSLSFVMKNFLKMSPFALQPEPPGSDPPSVSLLCRASLPHLPSGLLQQ